VLEQQKPDHEAGVYARSAVLAVERRERLCVLGDDTFPVQFRGVLEHLFSVSGEVLGVNDRELNIVLT
jgi:hypothetical protein